MLKPVCIAAMGAAGDASQFGNAAFVIGSITGMNSGMRSNVPTTLKRVWAIAVRFASVVPPNAASQAVTVVPMFMPNTVAAAVSNVMIPWMESVMAIAVVAAELCTTAVNTRDTMKHLSRPSTVPASRDANAARMDSFSLIGTTPLFIQYRPMNTNPSPIRARPRLCAVSRFMKK